MKFDVSLAGAGKLTGDCLGAVLANHPRVKEPVIIPVMA